MKKKLLLGILSGVFFAGAIACITVAAVNFGKNSKLSILMLPGTLLVGLGTICLMFWIFLSNATKLRNYQIQTIASVKKQAFDEIAVCGRCGAENDKDATFCDKCGAPLKKTCSVCGKNNDSDAEFCKYCGNKIKE